ncbi:MAG: glycosyltransferase, partial [Verrucomicrobiota bacterium]
LFVSPEASRTGAPIYLLHLLRWLRAKTELQFRVLLGRGGPLEAEFRALAETFIPETFGTDGSRLADVDLIYSNTCTNGALIHSLSCGDIPIVTHVHELDSAIEGFGRENFDRVRNHTSHFIACSQAVADGLMQRRQIPVDRISVHHGMVAVAELAFRTASGSRSEVRVRYDLPDDALVIAACGTVDWGKGPDLFLQLAALLHQQFAGCKPLHFVWIGLLRNDDLGRTLRRDCAQRGLTEFVHFVGAQENPHALLNACDLFCLPSRGDAFPLVMLEAGALDKPFVCFDGSGGAKEFAARGAGFTVPYLDVPAMAERFAQLIEDESLRQRTGSAAGKLVREDFDVEVSAPRVWARLQSLLSALPRSAHRVGSLRRECESLVQSGNWPAALRGLEHMPEAEVRAIIEETCRHTDHVVFFSTDSDCGEPTRINIRPAEYWIELFRRQGFFPDRHFEPGFITPQPMRFLRGKKQTLDVSVFSHEPPNCAVALVRLSGPICQLERQSRMRLRWCTVSAPQVNLEELLAGDLFVLQREFCERRISAPVVAAIRELGKPIVFELDDLLINVPESNPHHKHCESMTPDVLAMLREADFITVTTAPLKRYLEEAEGQAKGKIHVLPNYLNLDIWDGAQPPPEKPSKPFVIGWFGTATHDEDLAIIKPAIVRLVRKHAGRIVFKFWGYLPKDLEGLPGVQLVRGSQPDLRLHARDVVKSRIDLAVGPLLDHPFNHAKSDVKWLEYSICYIPGIYSTISPFTNSVEHGRTGWLVDNTTDAWVEAIELFMRDHQLRRTIAIQAHDEVRRSRCVDVGSERWDALYRSFQVSGPRPKSAAAQFASTAHDRAAAHMMLYRANLLSGKGQNEQATILCDQAVNRYIADDSATARLFRPVLEHYRTTIKDLQLDLQLATQLIVARAAADAGARDRAINLYLDALGSAQKIDNPVTVLRAILDIARAFLTLDQARGRKLLELGVQLARTIRSQEVMETIEQLMGEYQQERAPTKRPELHRREPKMPYPSAGKPFAPTSVVGADGEASKTPVVSIIIPVFSNLPLTRACLESIASTITIVTHEIIVVNNGSTDGTADFLKAEAAAGRLRTVSNLENLGFAKACNQGAKAARGQYVLFLNNDTEVQAGWLEALVQAARRPQMGVVGAKLLYADGRIQHAGIGFINDVPDHPHRHAPANAPEVNQFRELDMVTGACLLIRSELFGQLAGFDEAYRNGVEDIDLCLRARAAGWKVAYEPKAVVYHLEGQSEGRYNHVKENLQLFFSRWGKSFDKEKRFLPPQPAKVLTASRSLFLASGTTQAKAVSVDWMGSFFDYGSLSHVNCELSRALSVSPEINLQRVGNGLPTTPASVAFEDLSREVSATASANA